ncbi:hypothetical protein ACFQRL_00085 [Microbacterium fluvii]|uniref:Uncharacterized protein n=1 Tax=Microbacterium fluvii TaxID=415215 RepID=A0ABW2HC92_9MICO|nr:hypothetical protein [Microbacterium fluvii]MCU4670983.1 hypothetical protein [Microbacterium fluvii]
MSSKTSLRFELFWFVFSVAAVVLFTSTAITTVAHRSDWTPGFVDLPGWEMELPTWFTFGVNCVILVLTASLAVLTAALLIRRLRGQSESDIDESN